MMRQMRFPGSAKALGWGKEHGEKGRKIVAEGSGGRGPRISACVPETQIWLQGRKRNAPATDRKGPWELRHSSPR